MQEVQDRSTVKLDPQGHDLENSSLDHIIPSAPAYRAEEYPVVHLDVFVSCHRLISTATDYKHVIGSEQMASLRSLLPSISREHCVKLSIQGMIGCKYISSHLCRCAACSTCCALRLSITLEI